MRRDPKRLAACATASAGRRRDWRTGLTALGMHLVLACAAAAQSTWTQSFELQPGWNAIYLHVQPTVNDPEVVFADLIAAGCPNAAATCLRSVWTRGVEPGGAQYIQNPADALQRQPGWIAFVPPDQPEAAALVRSRLVSINGNRAFLIQLAGTQPVTLTVTGRPLPPLLTWQANAFNLIGLPVDPAAPPTFAAYFAPSGAHSAQPVYRLWADGVWRPVVLATEPMKYGEAYWIYTAGGSDFTAPLAIELPTSDGLSYGRTVDEHLLRFSNRSGAQITVRVQDLGSAGPSPLAYFRVNTTPGPQLGAFEWLPLAGALEVPVPANSTSGARLAVRRGAFPGDQPSAASVVAVSGAGVRWLIPFHATRLVAPATGAGAAAMSGVGGQGNERAGLWLGVVRVNAVSEPNSGSMQPMPTGGQGNRCAGGGNDGQACTTDADCPGSCQPAPTHCDGGINDRLPCEAGSDCPGARCGITGVCPAGPRKGAACGPKSCVSGSNDQKPCTGGSDCPSGSCAVFSYCAGGARDGEPCRQDAQCNPTPAVVGTPSATPTPRASCPLASAECPQSTCDTAHTMRCVGGAEHNLPCGRVGDVTCSATCAQSGAGSEFPLRLLVHVDRAGTARLLKQVTLMWENGSTRKQDPQNPNSPDVVTPGRYVLVTDDALTMKPPPGAPPGFTGAALVDGTPVGRRLSTPFFDFPEDSAPGAVKQALAMQGAFGTGKLTTEIHIPPGLPTNPFRHVHHPDHDDLDPMGNPFPTPGAEVFAVKREVALNFEAGAANPCRRDTADGGFDTVFGAYSETITGLHHTPITVAGCFELERIAVIGELNR